MSGSDRRKRRWAFPVIFLAVVLCGSLAWRPLLIEYRLYRARAGLQQHRDDQAAAWLQANLRLDPQHAETHFWLARTYRHLGQFGRVRRHLQRAWKLGVPVDRLQREQWLALAQTGQLRDAEPHLGPMLQNPQGEGPEICEAFVRGYLQNLQFDAADRLLDAWQADHPDDPDPYFLRGYMRQAVMDYGSAVKHYRRGLVIAPDRSDARLRLAQSLLAMNRLGEAETELRRLFRERPSDPEVMTPLGNCLFQRHQTAEARRILKDVATMFPDSWKARRLLGEIAVAEQEYDEAIGWLEPLRAQRPNDPALLLALAQAHRGRGHREKADELYEAVREAEQIESRLDELLRAVLKQRQDAQLRYEVASLLMKTGSREKAARWLRSVLQLDPQHREAHQALADYYSRAGDKQRAEQHRRRAKQLAEVSE